MNKKSIPLVTKNSSPGVESEMKSKQNIIKKTKLMLKIMVVKKKVLKKDKGEKCYVVVRI